MKILKNIRALVWLFIAICLGASVFAAADLEDEDNELRELSSQELHGYKIRRVMAAKISFPKSTILYTGFVFWIDVPQAFWDYEIVFKYRDRKGRVASSVLPHSAAKVIIRDIRDYSASRVPFTLYTMPRSEDAYEFFEETRSPHEDPFAIQETGLGILEGVLFGFCKYRSGALRAGAEEMVSSDDWSVCRREGNFKCSDKRGDRYGMRQWVPLSKVHPIRPKKRRTACLSAILRKVAEFVAY